MHWIRNKFFFTFSESEIIILDNYIRNKINIVDYIYQHEAANYGRDFKVKMNIEIMRKITCITCNVHVSLSVQFFDFKENLLCLQFILYYWAIHN